MIIKVFILGMLSALSVIFIGEIFPSFYLFNSDHFLSNAFHLFIGVALIEEFAKYSAVWIGLFRQTEGNRAEAALDEPTDIMIYMIIAGLGFAAFENILLLCTGFYPVFRLTFLRFIGATFLHALSSGIFGFLIALSYFELKKRKRLFLLGLFLATALHGLYNFFIMESKEMSPFLLSLVIFSVLINFGVFVSFAFKKLSKIKSVCKLPKNLFEK
ncbi:MAG: PrsW family glutamic-type intramembrane protease [Minisyncoccales bacterium]